MEQHSSSSLFNLSIDPLAKSHLGEAAKWARFLAIMGMVMLALMILFGLFFSSLIGSNALNPYEDASEPSTSVGAYMGTAMAVIYFILALIWFFPLLYLLRFSGAVKTALNANDQQALNTSFFNLKRCFRYVGIVTIVVLVFYAIVFAIAIIGGAASMF